MEAFVISCCVFVYFFLGGFVSGYLSHLYKTSKEAFITCVLLWPFVLAIALVYKVTVFAALWSQAFAIKISQKSVYKQDLCTQVCHNTIKRREERK